MSVIAKASATPFRKNSTRSRWASAARPAEASRGPARQRGAIGLFGILTLLLALVFTALAVDSGRLWFERRQLQSIADLAALEAARSLGCGHDPGQAAAIAQAAAKRNGFTGDLGTAPNRVELGGLATANHQRLFQGGTDDDAVHVLATKAVPASLVLGGFFGQNTLISAEATARGEPAHATFAAGSYLLRANTTSQDASLLNGLLGGLLGSSLSLDAVSYRGLASTDVNLAQLAQARGGVGSVEDLLATDLSVADVMNLAASAVSQQGAADATVTGGLQQIAAAAVNQATVHLGDVLDVAVPASDAAGKVGINLLDLVTTTIMVANHQHAVSLPLNVHVGTVLQSETLINIIQPPRIAVGPPGQDGAGNWCAQARTAQVEVGARVKLNATLGVSLVSVDLRLNTSIAQGEAHLETLDAIPGATRAVIGATSGIANPTLTNWDGTGPATAKLLGITIANIGLNLPVEPGRSSDLTYAVANPTASHLPATQSIASPLGTSMQTALSNPGAINVQVLPGLGLLSLTVNALVGPLLNTVLAPLLGQIGSLVLDPLLRLLGLQVGGLDVTVEDIEYTGGAQLVI